MTDEDPDRSESPSEPNQTDPAGDADDPISGDDSGETDIPTDPDDPAAPDDGDAPLSDLARRVSERRRTSQSGPPSGDEPAEPGTDAVGPELSDDGPSPDSDDDPFDRMSVGEIDEEALWSSLEGDAASERTVGVEGDAEPVSDAASDPGPGTDEYVVSKDAYCQSCPYLDDPPELACTHEGTEIVEVIDTDHFRVRNCPMVEK